MEPIVLYAESPACRGLPDALEGHPVVGAASRADLTRSIVCSGPVLAVVVCCDRLDEPLRRLLASLKRSFALLNLCVVAAGSGATAGGGPQPEGWTSVDSRQGPDTIAGEVRAFIGRISRADRRERPRFDWPLQGELALQPPTGDGPREHAIWALSADGAFLAAPDAAPPPAGTRGSLTIRFQNSRLSTLCEVLDPRRASSRLPAGFAVRFVDLPEASRRVLERLVQDALLRTLLEEPAEKAVPSLGEEELSIDGFQPL